MTADSDGHDGYDMISAEDENRKSASRPRPATMWGITERVTTGHGNTYVTVNFDDQGVPFEVFTAVGKAGGCDLANLEAVSRMVSLALRHGVDAKEIVEQLQGITCHPVWDAGVQVRSTPDALALVLNRHLEGKGLVPSQPPSLPSDEGVAG